MIDTLPRLSSATLAELESTLREIEQRHAALMRLAGVQDEEVARPIRDAAREAAHQLTQAEALMAFDASRAEALRRLDRAAERISAARAMLRELGAEE